MLQLYEIQDHYILYLHGVQLYIVGEHMNGCSYVNFYHIEKIEKTEKIRQARPAIFDDLASKKPCILCSLQDNREPKNKQKEL